MTAINVVLGRNAVHIISDGAAIDTGGRLAHLMHKVTPVPHLSAAIGVRGVRTTVSVVIDAVTAGATSYDDLHSRIVDILRGTFEPARLIWEAKFGPHVLRCDVIVAGWSEQHKGPHAFVVATSDANAAAGLPAWTVVEIAGTLLTPSDSKLAADFARLQLEFDDDAAIALITRQRAIAAPSPDNPPAPGPYGVGGFAQITTVGAHGIETRILKRWPDAIGETIKQH